MAESGPKVRFLTVEEDGHDQRVDNYLVKILKGVPKSRIYRMLRKGEVRVDGGRAKPTLRLRQGQTVRIPPVVSTQALAQAPPTGYVDALESAVIAETDDYLVIAKPSGVAVHGGSGVRLGLIESLRASRGGFLELVHRLDRDTSGVLMIAKRRAVLRDLHQAFRARQTVKRYRLLVHGQFERPQEVRLQLARWLTPSGERRVQLSRSGQSAHTSFQPLVSGQQVSTVEAQLHTGRTHQARVHALALGHPIVGDEKYLPDHLVEHPANRAAGRLMLHAHSLGIVLQGERLRFEAPVPGAFERVQTLIG